MFFTDDMRDSELNGKTHPYVKLYIYYYVCVVLGSVYI